MSNKQLNLSFIHDELKEVKTLKREFLEKMDAIMPWEIRMPTPRKKAMQRT